MKRRKPLLNRTPLRGKPTPAEPGRQRCGAPRCRKPATVWRGLHAWCSVECGAIVAQAAAAKLRRKAEAAALEERKATRAKLRAMRPLQAFLADTQEACNRYVRLRDADLPCISCGKVSGGDWHAGHYRSRKAAPELRFDLDNLHKQCAQCNLFLSGNLLEYRRGLLERIGAERVARLEGPHPRAKWTRDDLEDMRADFVQRARALKSGRIEFEGFAP